MDRLPFQGWTKGKDGSKQYQQLFNIAKLPIRRHVKVRGAANPYVLITLKIVMTKQIVIDGAVYPKRRYDLFV